LQKIAFTFLSHQYYIILLLYVDNIFNNQVLLKLLRFYDYDLQIEITTSFACYVWHSDSIKVCNFSIFCFRTIILTCTVFKQACKGCYDNCHYMMFSNKIGNILDLLSQRLLVSLNIHKFFAKAAVMLCIVPAFSFERIVQ
jgi:hypothetical protein